MPQVRRDREGWPQGAASSAVSWEETGWGHPSSGREDDERTGLPLFYIVKERTLLYPNASKGPVNVENFIKFAWLG